MILEKLTVCSVIVAITSVIFAILSCSVDCLWSYGNQALQWLQKSWSVRANMMVIVTSDPSFWSLWWAIKIDYIWHVKMHSCPIKNVVSSNYARQVPAHTSTCIAHTLSWVDLLKNLSCHQHNAIVQNSSGKTVKKTQVQITGKQKTNSNTSSQSEPGWPDYKAIWSSLWKFLLPLVFLHTFQFPSLLQNNFGEETLAVQRLDSHRNMLIEYQYI